MLSPTFIQELSERAAALFPGADGLKQDARQHMESLLQSAFTRLNMVSRDEFDAQVAALARAEAAIAALEARVASLEEKIAGRNSDSHNDAR